MQSRYNLGGGFSYIYDVAEENYFYDISPSEAFTSEYLEFLRKSGIEIDEDSPSQAFKKVFASKVEGHFSELIENILLPVTQNNICVFNNCYFISKEDKAKLATLLAYQFIRTKHTRNNVDEMISCLSQAMDAMGATSKLKKKNISTSGKTVQTQIMLDVKSMTKIAASFLKLNWSLGVNNTSKSFYTSDNPICTQAHVQDPIRSMSGLSSTGVEVFFPLSPKCVLIMCDGEYHKNMKGFERKYIQIYDSDYVAYYNSISALRSERCLYSQDGDFSLIDQMLQEKSTIFMQPSVQLLHGGKTYYPNLM